MFQVTGGKGFHIVFANGYALSVQFGPGNYCENHHAQSGGRLGIAPYDTVSICGAKGSCDAEIAVIAPDGSFMQIAPYDTVRGWVSPDEVARIMQIVATDPLSLVVADEVD